MDLLQEQNKRFAHKIKMRTLKELHLTLYPFARCPELLRIFCRGGT